MKRIVLRRDYLVSAIAVAVVVAILAAISAVFYGAYSYLLEAGELVAAASKNVIVLAMYLSMQPSFGGKILEPLVNITGVDIDKAYKLLNAIRDLDDVSLVITVYEFLFRLHESSVSLSLTCVEPSAALELGLLPGSLGLVEGRWPEKAGEVAVGKGRPITVTIPGRGVFTVPSFKVGDTVVLDISIYRHGKAVLVPIKFTVVGVYDTVLGPLTVGGPNKLLTSCSSFSAHLRSAGLDINFEKDAIPSMAIIVPRHGADLGKLVDKIRDLGKKLGIDLKVSATNIEAWTLVPAYLTFEAFESKFEKATASYMGYTATMLAACVGGAMTPLLLLLGRETRYIRLYAQSGITPRRYAIVVAIYVFAAATAGLLLSMLVVDSMYRFLLLLGWKVKGTPQYGLAHAMLVPVIGALAYMIAYYSAVRALRG